MLQDMEQRLQEEGLDPSAPSCERLSMLWEIYQSSEATVRSLNQQIQILQRERLAEIEKVQQYISNIKSLSKTRDCVALQLEEENKILHDALDEFNLQQDAQRKEIAEMLLQEGLAEIISMSLSEQVAYLLADRASLLEKTHHQDDAKQTSKHLQDVQKEKRENLVNVAALHVQSPWKRLLGLRKAAQSPQTLTTHTEDEQNTRKLQELERDVEEASARLSMAHKEIRRLTDELESAHLTQKAYEPELQEAQLEVEHLRLEVEKLKRCEVAELKKTKEVTEKQEEELCQLQATVKTLKMERIHLLDQEKVYRLKFLLQEQQKTNQQISGKQQTENERTTALIPSLELQLQVKSEEQKNLVDEIKSLQKVLQTREQELYFQMRKNTDLQKEITDTQQEDMKLQQEVVDMRRTLRTTQQETETLRFEIQQALVTVDAERG
ncbi:hypothetical protein DNTS_008630 [Danionella cerebrum]|uniref:Uncharacterized protein n=1 Tax=Danionella cerebrum TaxID=2873325 RepID=A0A553R2X3_9TELE|nr:hypothetical protein DNTS_008630 [Danionella translucida]